MPDEPKIAVANNPGEHRFEISLDGEQAGFVRYRSRPGLLDLVHTEIDDRFDEQGLGGRLVAQTLDDARAQDLAVLPSCPFVRSYIQRHPEYLDLVPEDRRAQFGL